MQDHLRLVPSYAIEFSEQKVNIELVRRHRIEPLQIAKSCILLAQGEVHSDSLEADGGILRCESDGSFVFFERFLRLSLLLHDLCFRFIPAPNTRGEERTDPTAQTSMAFERLISTARRK